eukprot:g643.t1
MAGHLHGQRRGLPGMTRRPFATLVLATALICQAASADNNADMPAMAARANGGDEGAVTSFHRSLNDKAPGAPSVTGSSATEFNALFSTLAGAGYDLSKQGADDAAGDIGHMLQLSPAPGPLGPASTDTTTCANHKCWTGTTAAATCERADPSQICYDSTKFVPTATGTFTQGSHTFTFTCADVIGKEQLVLPVVTDDAFMCRNNQLDAFAATCCSDQRSKCWVDPATMCLKPWNFVPDAIGAYDAATDTFKTCNQVALDIISGAQPGSTGAWDCSTEASLLLDSLAETGKNHAGDKFGAAAGGSCCFDGKSKCWKEPSAICKNPDTFRPEVIADQSPTKDSTGREYDNQLKCKNVRRAFETKTAFGKVGGYYDCTSPDPLNAIASDEGLAYANGAGVTSYGGKAGFDGLGCCSDGLSKCSHKAKTPNQAHTATNDALLSDYKHLFSKTSGQDFRDPHHCYTQFECTDAAGTKTGAVSAQSHFVERTYKDSTCTAAMNVEKKNDIDGLHSDEFLVVPHELHRFTGMEGCYRIPAGTVVQQPGNLILDSGGQVALSVSGVAPGVGFFCSASGCAHVASGFISDQAGLLYLDSGGQTR